MFCSLEEGGQDPQRGLVYAWWKGGCRKQEKHEKLPQHYMAFCE